MKTPQVSKKKLETIKTVFIAVLVTGIISFISGMHYQNNQNASVKAAVQASVSTKK